MPKPSSTDSVTRFWTSVEKTDECWNWTRALNNSGYGLFRLSAPERRMVSAHRFAYEIENGPVAEGMVLDHLCHNRRCVRPSHLRVVTHKQNSEHRIRASAHARSGVRGVVWNGTLGKWMSQVRNNGRLHIGGYFSTVEEAAESVRRMRLELYTHSDADLNRAADVLADVKAQDPCNSGGVCVDTSYPEYDVSSDGEDIPNRGKP
jgi:hypothetical protein